MKFTTLIAFFFISLFVTVAQSRHREFVHITVSDYEVIDSLPVFTEEIPLGDLAGDQFDVQILYPEYTKLMPSEKRILATMLKKGASKGELQLTYRLGVSRKEKILSVSFSPIIKKNGRWMRLSSCKIGITPRGRQQKIQRRSSITDRWTQTSVLSTGKWAKIRVSQEGIYELTPELLKKMGFSHPDRVKVYGYGGRLQDELLSFGATSDDVPNTFTPDDVVEVPTLRRSSGILFWAEGTQRWTYTPRTQRWKHLQNHYSRHSYYFVTEGDNPLSVETLPEVSPTSSPLTTVPFAVALDDDKEGWYEGGRRMFDAYDFAGGNNHTYKMTLPDFATSSDGGTVKVDIAFSASSATTPTTVEVTLNNEPAANLNIGIYNSIIEVARLANASFTQKVGSQELNFGFTTTRGNSARLDYIRVGYERRLRVAGTPYSFTPSTSGTTTLALADGNINTRVWRIGQTGSPTAQVPIHTAADGQLSFTTDTPLRRFVAFDATTAYPSPEFVSVIDNQNLHADTGIDYVILVPASGKLTAQAERLAEMHRKRSNLSVKVVRADQLYNEFSSGTPDANAYRRYLKMLYDRASSAAEAPRYFLLMGKSPWDGRMLSPHWKNKNPDDYLLAYEADASQYSVGTVYSYVTDDFFAMLDDGEGETIATDKPDIATGRMVCVTEAEAKRLVDKVETYLSNKDAGTWKNTIVLLGDDGDGNEHMEDADKVAAVLEHAGDDRFTLQKVYWDRYPRHSGATGFTYPAVTERVHTLMKQGAVMFNYHGHGAPNQVSHEKVLTLEDFKHAFSPTLPLWVLASCEIYPFDAADDNLAESSLYLPQGGSIAFMCASRAVYATQNNALNRHFCTYVVGRDAAGKRISMGEALRLAKVRLATPRTPGRNDAEDATINKLKYVLFGDPALELSIPTGNVVIDSLNGKVFDPTIDHRLPAGGVVRVSGHITTDGASNAVAETFSGTITTELFDRKETIVCKNNTAASESSGTTPFTYQEQVRSVFRGTNLVKNGRFSCTFVVPRDISYTDDAARLSFYAISDDKQTECNGVGTNFMLNGTSPDAAADTISPKVFAYLNNIDTPHMAVLNTSPTLVAKISDDCGINAAGSGLGHDMELVIDGNTAEAIVLNNFFTYDLGSYRQGEIVYPLSGLSPGVHTIDLRVWDINNNPTTARLSFIVRTDASSSSNLIATNNPATSSTTFALNFTPSASTETTVRFEVFDNQGRKVWIGEGKTAAGVGNYSHTWNLQTTATNSFLDDGVYLFRAVINNNDYHHTTSAQKLIILRQ